jgi:hypothetical protein
MWCYTAPQLIMYMISYGVLPSFSPPFIPVNGGYMHKQMR